MKVEKYLTLGVDWECGMTLDGWLVSEKMDGCRILFDGFNAWSRGGRLIHLPEHIRAALPVGRRLDGELWCGRGGFTEARNAVQFGHWTPRCRFTVFDCPDATGTWAERLAVAASLYGDCVPFVVCEDYKHANSMLLDVQSAGGEGLVFRHPTAIGYERGRSFNFVKVKGIIYVR
jgi:ATP-dependent DNA ligase